MSYIDLIIKYLAGELSPEESSAFEKELEWDAGLKKEYEKQSAAFILIRDQLQNRDEKQFRTRLEEAMKEKLPVTEPPLKRIRPWWYIPLAVAASLAIIFILRSPPEPQKIFARYHDPAGDAVVLAYLQDTRGESEPGIRQYRQGNYERSMEMLSLRLSQEEENMELMLFYLLSAMELDRQDELLEKILFASSDSMDLVNQALRWYGGLALLKSGNPEAARETIHPLSQGQGPYRSDARKLEKVLLK